MKLNCSSTRPATIISNGTGHTSHAPIALGFLNHGVAGDKMCNFERI